MRDNSAVRWLWEITDRKKWYIVILLLMQGVLGLSTLCYALLLRNIIDCAVGRDAHGFTFYLIGFGFLVVGQIVLRAVGRWVDELACSTLENMFKRRLFACLLRNDYSEVSSVHSGEWMNRLTNDAVVTANGLVRIIPNAVGVMVRMAGALVMIVALEPRLAYVLVPGGFAIILFTYAFRNKLKRLHMSIQEADGRLRVFMQENLGSLLVVKSFSAEDQVEAGVEERLNEHKATRMKRKKVSTLCSAGFSSAMNGMYLMGIVYGCIGIMNGTISYGTLIALMQLISQIQSPLASMTSFMPKYYAMIASAERLMYAERFRTHYPQGQISSEEIVSFYENDFEALVIQEACFSYCSYKDDEIDKEGMPIVLNNINFSIRKGEYVALTGASGCGKSTLIKIMMCIYPLRSGRRFLITSEGEIPLESKWGRMFAYVPQGNHLMSGSVRDVITFSNPSCRDNEEAILQALHISCSDEFVGELENGVDTLLGERGAGLSEGQMQRLAIARAVFSNAPIILLDEATSALDGPTESRVINRLRRMTDRTVVIVTHRRAALSICDKIIKFSDIGVETETEVV